VIPTGINVVNDQTREAAAGCEKKNNREDEPSFSYQIAQ